MVKRKTLDLSLSLFCKAIVFATYKTLLNVQYQAACKACGSELTK